MSRHSSQEIHILRSVHAEIGMAMLEREDEVDPATGMFVLTLVHQSLADAEKDLPPGEHVFLLTGEQLDHLTHMLQVALMSMREQGWAP